MPRRTVVVVTGLVFAFARPLLAQKARLGPDDVRMAVAYGATLKIEKTGLRMPLFSGGERSLIGMFRGVWEKRTAEAQGITLFTPTSWIHRAAAEANALLRPFSPGDLTADDVSPVLRVFTNVGADQIVIRRAPDVNDMVRPVRFERYDGLIPYRGDTLATRNMVAVFDLAALEQLRERHPAHEFTVVLIGLSENDRRGGSMDVRNVATFQVVIQEKHFKELP